MDLERLLDTWRGPLIGLLAAWGASSSEAPELAQDVFAEAWISRARFDGDPGDGLRVGAWLRGIARNLWLAAQRERARRGSERAPSVAESSAARETGEPDERSAALREALDALEPELREALYVRHVEESSLAIVASLLGVTERAAEGRLYRGRQLLKERVERLAKRQEVQP